MARPLLLLVAAATALLTRHTAHAFAVGPNPPNPAQQQRPPPTSPYERRDRPMMDPDDAATAPAPFVLGPGSRVAVVGADSGALGRLVTKKLFQAQFRPYLMVKDQQVPSGLGLDQYKVCVVGVCSTVMITGQSNNKVVFDDMDICPPQINATPCAHTHIQYRG